MFQCALFPKLKLVLHQGIIVSLEVDQFLMCAPFGNLTLIEHHDLVGMFYRAQPVCHTTTVFPFKN